MLIVVTDGKEECAGDPIGAMNALRAAGLAVTLNVVGFGLTDAADRDAMTKLASAGGGRFFDAQGAAGLKSAVEQAMAVPFAVVDATGAVVGRGIVGGAAITVPTGDLSVRLETAATPLVIDHVVVAPAKATTVELNKDGDKVASRIVP
jgi:Ca-activated chloride channel family protein